MAGGHKFVLLVHDGVVLYSNTLFALLITRGRTTVRTEEAVHVSGAVLYI
jgi:hypothetical protein